jgi:hypothetical protein
MAEIVNLRGQRKKKARAEKELRAAENRIAFGRSKAERESTKAVNEMAERHLDLHRREDEAE